MTSDQAVKKKRHGGDSSAIGELSTAKRSKKKPRNEGLHLPAKHQPTKDSGEAAWAKRAQLTSERTEVPANGHVGSASISTPGQYPYLSSPKFWDDAPPISTSKKLYGTILHLRRCTPSECRPLVLLTGKRLPIFADGPEIQLDVGQNQSKDGVDSVVRFIDAGKVKKWTGSLDDANSWMGRVLGDLSNSRWKAKEGEPKWVVLPLRKDFKVPPPPDFPDYPPRMPGFEHVLGKGKKREEMPALAAQPPAKEEAIKLRTKHIDWDEVNRANSTSSSSFDLSDPNSLVARALEATFEISDPVTSFKTYLCVSKVRSDLNIMSPDPTNPGRTFLDGVVLSGDTYIKHPKQPILQCSTIRLSQGGWATQRECEAEATFIIPELVQLHQSAGSATRAISSLPAMLIALDDWMLAVEANQRFFMESIHPRMLLQALTSAERARGEVDKSYDRLELFGDTVIKLITTIDTYLTANAQNGRLPEGLLAHRQIINSNAELRKGLLHADIVGYVRGPQVTFTAWRPEGWTVEELMEHPPKKKRKREQEDGTQTLGNKEVADVAEALIGAAYLSNEGSWDSARSMCIFLGVPIKNFDNWSEVRHEFERLSQLKAPPPDPKVDETPGINVPVSRGGKNGGAKWLEAFKPADTAKRVLGYKFHYTSNGIVIKDAQMGITDTAQLQNYMILGEALLDFLVVQDLYHTFPQARAGELAAMKTSRTTKECQAAMGVHVDLFSQLNADSVKPGSEVQAFTKAFRSARQQQDLQIKQTSKKENPYWTQIDGGKFRTAKGAHLLSMFGDLLQAMLGSIFLDSGADLYLLREAYRKELKPFLDKYCESIPRE